MDNQKQGKGSLLICTQFLVLTIIKLIIDSISNLETTLFKTKEADVCTPASFVYSFVWLRIHFYWLQPDNTDPV
jgi:hypothetical protein